MKLRDARMEIAKLTASLSFNEQSHLQAKQSLEIRITELEQDLVANETKTSILQEKYEAKMRDLHGEISAKDVEIASLKDQMESKSSMTQRQEQSFGVEISRLEKKLAAQVTCVHSTHSGIKKMCGDSLLLLLLIMWYRENSVRNYSARIRTRPFKSTKSITNTARKYER